VRRPRGPQVCRANISPSFHSPAWPDRIPAPFSFYSVSLSTTYLPHGTLPYPPFQFAHTPIDCSIVSPHHIRRRHSAICVPRARGPSPHVSQLRLGCFPACRLPSGSQRDLQHSTWRVCSLFGSHYGLHLWLHCIPARQYRAARIMCMLRLVRVLPH
jgi:hypothetical protein